MTELPVVRLVDIRETALDAQEVLATLADEASGGVTLFVGAVRDHDGGKHVTGLDYSAHPTALDRLRAVRDHDGGKHVTGLDYSAHPTALDQLRAVCDEVAAAYDVRAVAAVHRIGTLAIGDAAVIVATAAAHRGEAFAASRALIDRLKETVPIWKHQVFADGTDEWVGTP